MPYFVYRIKPFTQLEEEARYESFAPASAHAKRLRAEGLPDTERVKVIFAEDAFQAEDLLSQVRSRPAGPDGDD